MSTGDRYLELAGSPFGGWLMERLGLPKPLALVRRNDRAAAKRRPVLIGAAKGGRLLPALAALFKADQIVSFYHPDADSWRAEAERSGLMTARFGANSGKLGALVFDATGIETVAGLDALYRFFHEAIRSAGVNGRILVLSTPPQDAATVEQAAVQRGLEGFTRSLAKEARRAIAVQLVEVAPGAEQAIGSTLRFFLSPASAFVSGQVARVGIPAETETESGTGKRTVLVTGAAQGIGASIAALFAKRDDTVIALDVPAARDALEETGRKIGAETLALDITSADAPDKILAAAKAHGGFDVVIHNAGITRDKTIARMELSRWEDVLSVNLEAPLRITEALLDGKGLRSNGRIVCVSSLSGIAGNLGQTNYALSKAGVIGLVDRLSSVAQREGATINAVAPGFIETSMTATIPFAIREAGRRLNSLGQGGLPIDVAETIAWLADPASGGVNGQTIRVCGQSLLGA